MEKEKINPKIKMQIDECINFFKENYDNLIEIKYDCDINYCQIIFDGLIYSEQLIFLQKTSLDWFICTTKRSTISVMITLDSEKNYNAM